MTDELKPVNCGCGGEAYYEAYENYNFGSYIAHIVICDKCGMRTAEWPSEDEAIEAWNRAMSGSTEKSSTVERTAKVKTVEKPNVFKCSECGQYFHSTAWGSPVEYCSRCGAKLDWNEDIPMEYFESGGR